MVALLEYFDLFPILSTNSTGIMLDEVPLWNNHILDRVPNTSLCM